MNNTAEVTREPHALDSVAIKSKCPSWEERVGAWNGSMTFDDRMSWLHTSHVRVGNGPEQFIFYLEMADRYGETCFFDNTPGCAALAKTLHSTHEKVSCLKTALSRKAFAVLCDVFFKQEEPPYPYDLPYKEPLFSKLLWFFRPYDGDGGYDNLRPTQTYGLGKDGGKHYILTANQFARTFVRRAWEMLNFNRHSFVGLEQPPDPGVAKSHCREIILLLRHLDLLGLVTQPNTTLRVSVFKEMLRIICEEIRMEYTEAIIKDALLGGACLEVPVRVGDKLAEALYIARLSVRIGAD